MAKGNRLDEDWGDDLEGAGKKPGVVAGLVEKVFGGFKTSLETRRDLKKAEAERRKEEDDEYRFRHPLPDTDWDDEDGGKKKKGFFSR